MKIIWLIFDKDSERDMAMLARVKARIARFIIRVVMLYGFIVFCCGLRLEGLVAMILSQLLDMPKNSREIKGEKP